MCSLLGKDGRHFLHFTMSRKRLNQITISQMNMDKMAEKFVVKDALFRRCAVWKSYANLTVINNDK